VLRYVSLLKEGKGGKGKGGCLFSFTFHFGFVNWDGIWGCAKVYGRGTLYMKWGQENKIFSTMRLRGEKDENEKIDNY